MMYREEVERRERQWAARAMTVPHRCPLCRMWCASWLARALHLAECHGWHCTVKH